MENKRIMHSDSYAQTHYFRLSTAQVSDVTRGTRDKKREIKTCMT